MDEKSKQLNQDTSEATPGATNNRLKKALIRGLAAFVAALLLLGVTRLSIVNLLKGPTEIYDLHNAQQGDFVKFGVSAIMGLYDENDASGEKGTYAILPMQGKFVTLRLSPRYLESAEAVKTQSLNFLNGASSDMDKYFMVEGTVKTLSEPLHDQLYRWFDGQKSWMQEIGLLPEVQDSSIYISNVVLEVDSVNGMNEGLVLAFTGLAALLLLYLLAELVLMASGFYLRKPRKKAEVQEGTEIAAADEVPQEAGYAADVSAGISKEDSFTENIDAPDNESDTSTEDEQ